MFFVIGDEVVHDLGDVKESVFWADSYERAEVGDLDYFSLDNLVKLREER